MQDRDTPAHGYEPMSLAQIADGIGEFAKAIERMDEDTLDRALADHLLWYIQRGFAGPLVQALRALGRDAVVQPVALQNLLIRN